MVLAVDRESQVPAYVQIRNHLREQILRGDLPQGTRLPPERTMAKKLGVSRTTVVSAYHELAAEGLLEARVGHGTVVTAPALGLAEGGPGVQPIAWTAHVTTLGKRLQGWPVPAEMVSLVHLCSKPDVIQLCIGRPDDSLMPIDRIREAVDAVLCRSGAAAVGMTPTYGIPTLREMIASRLVSAGVATDADHVVVLSGAHQGFDILVRLLAEPGDTVITEAPTYIGALEVFQAEGLRVIGVPVDREGMDVDRAEPIIARYRPRFIYVVPTFQNPTGTTMSLGRREKLLRLAQQYQVPIVEDDAFGDLYFDDPPVPKLKALDRFGHVLYLGTISKALAIGLRIGWLVAPKPVVDVAAHLKALVDFQPPALAQHLVVELIDRGWLDEHVAAMRSVYAARCRAMDAALRRHLPREARWRVPEGGMFLWLELPPQVSAQDLLEAAGPRGVSFLPGHFLYPSGGPANTCRLCYSTTDEQEIEQGIRILGSTLRELMRRRTEQPADRTALEPIA